MEDTQKEINEVLDKIRAEIGEIQLIGYATVDGKREIASRAVLQIIDKYREEQDPKYCDRNICVSNEYNGIGCNECEVTKSQEFKTEH